MNVVIIKNLLSSIFQTLASRDLTSEEHEAYKDELKEYHGLIVAFAAANCRFNTFIYFKSLPGVSLAPLHQWIKDCQKITENGLTFSVNPSFDSVISDAVYEDAPEFLTHLIYLDPEASTVIIDNLKRHDYKSLVEKWKIRTTLPEIDRFVTESCKKDESILGLLEAIKTNDIPYVQQHAFTDLPEDVKEYAVMLAAGLARTEILQELIDKKSFPTIHFKKWALSGDNQYKKWGIYYNGEFHSKVKDLSQILTQQIQENNENYVAFLEAWINRQGGMKEWQQRSLIDAAIDLDDVNVLSTLKQRFHCAFEPKDYSWQEDVNRRVYPRITSAKDDFDYSSAFLRAASKQKLNVFTWFLSSPECKEDDYKRCVEMARAGNRPQLEAKLYSRVEEHPNQVHDFEVVNYVDRFAFEKDRTRSYVYLDSESALEAFISLMNSPPRILTTLMDRISLYNESLQKYCIRNLCDQKGLDRLTRLREAYIERCLLDTIIPSELTDIFECIDRAVSYSFNLIRIEGLIRQRQELAEKDLQEISEALTHGAHTFLLNAVIETDSLPLLKRFFSADSTRLRAALIAAAKADAISIFKYLFVSFPNLSTSEDWKEWNALAKDDKHPQLKAYLSKFKISPYCINSAMFFKVLTDKVKGDDGKNYRVSFVEADSDSEEGTPVLQKS